MDLDLLADRIRESDAFPKGVTVAVEDRKEEEGGPYLSLTFTEFPHPTAPEVETRLAPVLEGVSYRVSRAQKIPDGDNLAWVFVVNL